MNFNQAIQDLATYYKLDAKKLRAYADEDVIGGYDEKHNGEQTRAGSPVWPMGSLWEVEGKILYALIRALKPLHVLEIGSFRGCSTTHICEALLKNGKGKLTSVDILSGFNAPAKYKRVLKQVQSDLMDYTFPKTPKFGFVLEDALHTPEQVAHVWGQFKTNAKKGATILSHDAEHWAVGEDVKRGIEMVTGEYKTMLVEPSDCGFAYWQKPAAIVTREKVQKPKQKPKYPNPDDLRVDPFNYTVLGGGELVLGSIPTTGEDIETLANQGVKSILSMTETPITHYPGVEEVLKKHKIDVHQCPTKDLNPPNDKLALKALDYIESSDKPIYIHCRGGIGRSGIITIAYLAIKRDMSLGDAKTFVSKRRNYQGNAHAAAQGAGQKNWVEAFIAKHKSS